MNDLLGPASVPNSTTVQPTDTRTFGATDTFFQDCPPGTTTGGTFISAGWFNGIMQQMRNAIRGMGMPAANISSSNPNMLLQAIQLAGKNPPYGQDSSTTPGQIDVTLQPQPNAIGAGDHILVKVSQPCPSTGVTITIASIGTFNVTHNDATALVQGDYAVGQVLDLRFDGTEFQMGRSIQVAAGSITAPMLASGAAPLPFVAVQTADNLQISNDATNATRDVDVSIGRVRDDSDITNMVLAGAMAKRLDTAWAPGGAAGSTSQGACDSGAKSANQTWHLYLIGKLGIAASSFSRSSNVASLALPSGHNQGVGGTIRVVGVGGGFDGVAVITAVTATSVSYNNGGANVGTTAVAATVDGFDMLASQTYPAPTMPSGWTTKQCLGSVLTDVSGNILSFRQYRDEFLFTTPILSVSALGGGSDLLETMKVPLGVKVKASLTLGVETGASAGNSYEMYACPPDMADPGTGISTITAPGVLVFSLTSSAAVNGGGGGADIWTNTSAQVRLVTAGVGTGYATTKGWRDPRRGLF